MRDEDVYMRMRRNPERDYSYLAYGIPYRSAIQPEQKYPDKKEEWDPYGPLSRYKADYQGQRPPKYRPRKFDYRY